MIIYKGKALSQWAREKGINASTLIHRYHRGLRDDELLSPIKTEYKTKKYLYNGQMLTISEIAKARGTYYTEAYRFVQEREPIGSADIEAELKGAIPVKGLYSGCSDEVKTALIMGDINMLMRAS